MPILQTNSDLQSSNQKLSKIETLRLARNYILAMSQTLQEGKPMDIMRFIKILSRELSQTTANLLNGTLMGPVNNSLVNYRRYITGDIPNNNGIHSNYSSSSDWQDCSRSNNNLATDYNPVYGNRWDPLKIPFSSLRTTSSDYWYENNYVQTNCSYYDGYYSKPLYSMEW